MLIIGNTVQPTLPCWVVPTTGSLSIIARSFAVVLSFNFQPFSEISLRKPLSRYQKRNFQPIRAKFVTELLNVLFGLSKRLFAYKLTIKFSIYTTLIL